MTIMCKNLGTIQNNDANNILLAGSGKDITPDEYRTAVGHLLDGKPGVLAQNVGMPDPVTYRSKVATSWSKHLLETSLITWPKAVAVSDTVRENAERQVKAAASLVSAGTDPLQLTAEMCHERGVPIVASYRMNSEDLYANTWRMSDFGRAHPDWRIPDAGCLDPAVPGVYEHRMEIFAEVAQQYDIDGIEFDFRRWYRMISNPLENHPVLTKMVRETRRMLDETARAKGRKKLLLGARVGPSLADPSGTEYAGGDVTTDISCRELGLDVVTWIEEGLVDYVCPSLFWPRLPGIPKTAEFVALAKDKEVGVYPTVFPLPAWGEEGVSISDMSPAEIAGMMKRHRDEMCDAALACYEEGADGISTFNWFGHAQFSHLIKQRGPAQNTYRSSLPYMKTELFVHRFLSSPEKLRECLEKEPDVALHCEWPGD